jgi:hypothetical protein
LVIARHAHPQVPLSRSSRTHPDGIDYLDLVQQAHETPLSATSPTTTCPCLAWKHVPAELHADGDHDQAGCDQ